MRRSNLFFCQLATAFMVSLSAMACTSYKLVHEIKLIGFDGNVGKGKSLAEITGKECSYHALGYWFGGEPTLDQALAAARANTAVRYLNNVTMTTEDFNAVIFGKGCVIVTGLGFE